MANVVDRRPAENRGWLISFDLYTRDLRGARLHLHDITSGVHVPCHKNGNDVI